MTINPDTTAGGFLQYVHAQHPPDKEYRDDGPGDLNVVTSRPPGANGVSGDGIVCVLSFQAKASGESNISIRQAAAVDSSQQTVEGQGGQISIVVK